MKRPGLYLTLLFISIICSAAIVSTAVSGICKSFQKGESENVKVTTPSTTNNNDVKQASVRL